MYKRKIIPYNPNLKELTRQLRNNSTMAEIKLWKYLKNKQIHGYDFHRQKSIGDYILDFFCHELMLGIELDGYSHQFEDVFKKDKAKEKRMNEIGINILRFQNKEVVENIDNVLMAIETFISEREKTHPLPFSSIAMHTSLYSLYFVPNGTIKIRLSSFINVSSLCAFYVLSAPEGLYVL